MKQRPQSFFSRDGDFTPLPLLGNPHIQTVLALFLGGPTLDYPTHERQVRLVDGDRLLLYDNVPTGWRPGGRIAMTSWANDGFAGELFKLTGSFMPPPAPGVQSPPLWGVEEHIGQVFASAGVTAVTARETVDFDFPSVDDAVQRYADDFGPFVIARGVLEPQERWGEFLQAFEDLIRRFNPVSDGTVRIGSDYFVISVER